MLNHPRMKRIACGAVVGAYGQPVVINLVINASGNTVPDTPGPPATHGSWLGTR
jgi:hypothetical protein